MNDTVAAALARALEEDRTVVLATMISGRDIGRQVLLDADGTIVAGGLGGPALDEAARAHARALVPASGCRKVSVAADDSAPADLFVEVHGPAPQLVVVGAVHVAIPLVHFAKLLGFRTVVIDPRPVFATPARFGHADTLIAEWPDDAFSHVRLHEQTCVAVLSHDLKIDVPAISAALRGPVPYIGALGSRKTQAKRAKALVEEGFTGEDLARIHSPIGLDLGGRRAEEVALSIVAEIVAVTRGGSASRAAAPRSDG